MYVVVVALDDVIRNESPVVFSISLGLSVVANMRVCLKSLDGAIPHGCIPMEGSGKSGN